MHNHQQLSLVSLRFLINTLKSINYCYELLKKITYEKLLAYSYLSFDSQIWWKHFNWNVESLSSCINQWQLWIHNTKQLFAVQPQHYIVYFLATEVQCWSQSWLNFIIIIIIAVVLQWVHVVHLVVAPPGPHTPA